VLAGFDEKSSGKQMSDGSRKAVGGGKYLGVVDLATQELKDIYNAQSWGQFWSLDWSGDDRRLVTLKSRASFSKLNDEIWIFPSDGEEPVKQPLPGLFAGLSVSADGKYAGILHLEHHGQIWVLENFLPAPRRSSAD
jgi:hypothetical protein